MSVPARPRRVQTFSTEGSARKHLIETIRSFSERKKEDHVFSGEHYQFLLDFLDRPSSKASLRYSAEGDDPFVPVYLHINDGDTAPDEPKIHACRSPDDIERVLWKHMPSSGQSSMTVFLHGWQSSEVLRVLAAQCSIDPEFLRRHLHFLETRSFYDLPPLPSHNINSTASIWRLRIATVCNRKVVLRPDEVNEARRVDLDAVKRYLNEIRSSQRSGNSIVRRWAILNETTSIIYQDVSLYVRQRKSGDWIGTIWLDSGRPFEDCAIPAPWLHQPDLAAQDHGPYDAYLPVVCHLPKSVLTPLGSSIDDTGRSDLNTRLTKVPSPSLAMLPVQYGATLDKKLSRVDALYAFSELITLASSSENQCLNLLQEHVESSLRFFRGQEDRTIRDLQYLKVLLEEHAERALATTHLLHNEPNSEWPRAQSTRDSVLRETMRQHLLDDYRELYRRSCALSQRVQDGADFITTDVSARAAQKSIDQASEVNRLTLLAYFFLPISFVTSIFGMNMVTFQDIRLGVASLFLTLFVIMVPSLIICFWHKIPCISRRISCYTL